MSSLLSTLPALNYLHLVWAVYRYCIPYKYDVFWLLTKPHDKLKNQPLKNCLANDACFFAHAICFLPRSATIKAFFRTPALCDRRFHWFDPALMPWAFWKQLEADQVLRTPVCCFTLIAKQRLYMDSGWFWMILDDSGSQLIVGIWMDSFLSCRQPKRGIVSADFKWAGSKFWHPCPGVMHLKSLRRGDIPKASIAWGNLVSWQKSGAHTPGCCQLEHQAEGRTVYTTSHNCIFATCVFTLARYR